MLFKRKYEFKPDKTETGILHKLYVTKKQRMAVLKWLLMAAVLVALSVVQDVVLSEITLFGGRLDILATALLLICIMQDPEAGGVFILAASSIYYFSGSAPGTYVIALLTVLGVLMAIFRHSYLYDRFSSVIGCTVVAVVAYELLIFAIGVFLGHTTAARFSGFLATGVLSAAAMPLLYPLFAAIGKIGGESWKE